MPSIGKTQKQYSRLVTFLNKRHSNGRKARLLEVGAGEMVLKQWLPKSIQYDSMDFGAEHNPSLSKNKRYTYLFDLDSGKFPIKDGTYDYVVCFETLEHVMYPDKVLEEIKRVAKNDAVFFLSLPNEYNFAQRIYFLLGKKTYCDEPFQVVAKHLHIHKPRKKDIIELFSKHFSLKEINYVWQSTLLPSWTDEIVNLLAQMLPSIFSRIVIVIATKKNVN